MARKILLQVLIDDVEEADDEYIADFAVTALGSWGGQLDPDDPLFDSLNVHHVKIRGTTYEYSEED